MDIRSPEEFERLRIPGSINVALYAVKTKAYLKAQPFVLVGAGFEWRDLETESKCLHQSGFKPSILCGGLVAWQSQGGLLEGDRLLVAIYKEIPAHLFLHEKDYRRYKGFRRLTKATTRSRKTNSRNHLREKHRKPREAVQAIRSHMPHPGVVKR